MLRQAQLGTSTSEACRARAPVRNGAPINLDLDKMNDQKVAVWYNDNVIYPNKIKLNCYYYRHYSFIQGYSDDTLHGVREEDAVCGGSDLA